MAARAIGAWRWGAMGIAVLAFAGVALTRQPPEDAVRTITLSSSPNGVAIDARNGHIFVLSGGYTGFRTGIAASAAAGGSNSYLLGTNGGGFSYAGADGVTILNSNGKVLATAPVGPDPRSVMVDEKGNRAYVANDDDESVTVIDATNGHVLGALHTASRPRTVAVDDSHHRAFVVGVSGEISTIDTQHGSLLKTASTNLSLGFFDNPAQIDVSTGRVYVGDQIGLRVLDLHSGRLLRSIVIGTPVTHVALDAARQRAYAIGSAGLSIFDLRRMTVLRTIPLAGNPSAVAIDPRRDRIFVAGTGPLDSYGTPTGMGRLTVLDARTARPLKTVPVGMAPTSIAVDERTGQAIVANNGGSVLQADTWSWMPGWLRDHLPFLSRATAIESVPGSISIIAPGASGS